MSALSQRVGWETNLAKYEAQRKCEDRASTNSFPWPRASNVRYPLSDMIIEQKKPFYYKILYGSEYVANFKAMRSELIPFSQAVACYFDWHIKQLTNMEEEIQYCIDKILQDAETVVKLSWDVKGERVVIEYVDNLFVIVPPDAISLDDAGWVVHVLQLNESDVRKQWDGVEGLDGLIEAARGSDLNNDTGNRHEAEYDRQGITRTGKDFEKIVLWELHYKDAKGGYRIKTLSPDMIEFDFGDDREYLCPLGRFAFAHGKREKMSKTFHGSRGIPEIVREGEWSLSSMWRAKHNAMTLYNAPLLYAAGGLPPGSTNNLSWQPGTILPMQLARVDLGSPPISWDQEMQNTRSIWERRVSTPDYGLGQSNTLDTSRTATEIKSINFQNTIGAELETGNWRMFLQDIFIIAWKMIVHYKPKTLSYILNDQVLALPSVALSDQYAIRVSGSAENVNREVMLQRAQMLFQICMGSPNGNKEEAAKNLIDTIVPGESQRYFIPTGETGQRDLEAAADDLTKLMIGFAVTAKPGDNFYVNAVTALQFMQAKAAAGERLTQQQVNLVSAYVAQNRQALRQTDPEKFKLLTSQLDQLDKAMHAQQEQQRMQSQGPAGLSEPNGALPAQVSAQDLNPSKPVGVQA